MAILLGTLKVFDRQNGKVIARFSPKTLPDSPEVIAAIEKALK
jgi:glutathione peroxidase-family protein